MFPSLWGPFNSNFELFDENLIDDHFSDKFKVFFLPNYYMYLDILFPYFKYVDPNKSNFFGCMYYKSRTSSSKAFLGLC